MSTKKVYRQRVSFEIEGSVFDPAGCVNPEDLIAAVLKVCPSARLVPNSVDVTPIKEAA